MVAAGEAIERARPDFAEDATGTVRVASGPMTIRFIARRLPELLDALPGIEIELYSSYSLINLSRREADIALRNRRPEEGRLAMRALPQPSYAVFGAKTYVARHPVAATAGRYDGCRWIGFDETRGHSESLLWLTAKIGRAPHIRCSNASAILDALMAGAGLAVLPCFLGAEEPTLMQLTAPIDELDREGLWLVVHEDMRDRRACAWPRTASLPCSTAIATCCSRRARADVIAARSASGIRHRCRPSTVRGPATRPIQLGELRALLRPFDPRQDQVERCDQPRGMRCGRRPWPSPGGHWSNPRSRRQWALRSRGSSIGSRRWRRQRQNRPS